MTVRTPTSSPELVPVRGPIFMDEIGNAPQLTMMSINRKETQ